MIGRGAPASVSSGPQIADRTTPKGLSQKDLIPKDLRGERSAPAAPGAVAATAILIIAAPRGAVAGIEVAGNDDANGFDPARHVGDAAETAFRQEFIVVAPP